MATSKYRTIGEETLTVDAETGEVVARDSWRLSDFWPPWMASDSEWRLRNEADRQRLLTRSKEVL